MARKPYQTVLEAFPDHLKAIGTLAVEIVNLEMRLANLLSAILQLPRRAGHEIYFTPRANTLRVAVLKNTASELLRPLPTTRSKVVSLAARSWGVIDQRSKVLHDAWGTPNRLYITRHELPITRKQKTPPALASLSSITTLVEQVRDLMIESVRITDQLERAPKYGAWLRKQHRQDRAEIRAAEAILGRNQKAARPTRKAPPRSSRA